MEKFAQTVRLLDLYGRLLTEKQRDVLDLHLNYDLSLQEIAQNEGISRQAVHDLIKRAEHTLWDVEEKLGFRTRLDAIEHCVREIDTDLLARPVETMTQPRATALLKKLRELLGSL